MNTGAVILAGGESKRMGKIKALLPVNEIPIIRYLGDRLIETDLHPLVIVLGAHRKQIAPALEGMPIGVIDNPDWQNGLGTSIRMGLVGSYMITKGIDALIFMAVDMPEVSVEHLESLKKAAESEVDVVFTEGTDFPFIVKSSAFLQILDLNHDQAIESLKKLPHLEIDFGGMLDLNHYDDYLNYECKP